MTKLSLRDAYVASLERQNDELRMRIAQLETEIGLRNNIPLVFGLTGSEARLLSMLVQRGFATKEQLLIAATNDVTGNKVPDIKIVDVYVCKIRRKLEKFDITIETSWGRGYNLTAENRAKVGIYLNAASGDGHGTFQQSATDDGRLHAAAVR